MFTKMFALRFATLYIALANAEKGSMVKKRKPGRPRVSRAAALGEVIAVRLTKDLLARLDQWRNDRPDKPSRSHAVRSLTESALSNGR